MQPLAGPYCIDTPCKTVWTVGMRVHAIGRHRTMCFSVRPRCHPTLMIGGMFGLLSNESAHTTDGEHQRLSARSGRRLMSYLSEHGFTGHSLSPSIILHQADPRTATSQDANPHAHHSASVQPPMVLGNPLALRIAERRWDRVMR